jgi:hypothetical protein
MNIPMNVADESGHEKEDQCKMSEIDSITLEYFTNKSQYANILKKKEQCQLVNLSSDKKFYKKRILDLTKRLFRDETENEQLVSGFHSYIKTCISYLKNIDTKDIIQEKYADSDADKNQVIDNNIVDMSSISIENESYKNCDYLFGKVEEVKKVNLDSFVINNSEKNKKIILPKKEEVNIKTKVHKTKGIVKKKKSEKMEKLEI